MSDWAEFIRASEPVQRAGVERELRRAVAERGKDYVYPRRVGDNGVEYIGPACQYVRDDAPSCLVGVVLHALGVPLDRLKEADDGDGTRADTLARELGAFASVSRILYSAQIVQDGGRTWGEAQDIALDVEVH